MCQGIICGVLKVVNTSSQCTKAKPTDKGL